MMRKLFGTLAAACLALALLPATALAADEALPDWVDGSNSDAYVVKNGKTSIKLGSDVTLTGKGLKIDHDVTLDLNGHTLNVYDRLDIASGRTLTLKGTGGGEIVIGRKDVHSAVAVSGTLKAYGGTIRSNERLCIQVYSGGTITCDNGATPTTFSLPVSLQGTISGGTFSDVVQTAENDAYISGGTFNGSVCDGASYSTVYNLNISGGTFNNSVYVYANALNISGGTFNRFVGVDPAPSTTANAKANISGGMFYGSISDKCTLTNGSHKITFMNGDSTHATQVVASGKTTVEPKAPTAPANQRFTGWYTNESCTDKFSFDRTLAKDIGLYAGFESTIASATVTANAPTYNGSAQALVSVSNMKHGTVKYSLDASTDLSAYTDAVPTEKNAANYTVYYYVKADADYTDSAKQSVSVTIAPKEVTVSGITAEDKTYDGNTAATLEYDAATISGKVDGDALTVSATGAFADKTVGEDKTVSISDLILGGKDAVNYVLATSGQQTETTADIAKKAVTLQSAGASKAYDGSALTNETVTASGMAAGEGFDYDFTGAQTDIGSSENQFTAKDSDTAKVSNYDITYDYGTLTVSLPANVGDAVKDMTEDTVTSDDREAVEATQKTAEDYLGMEPTEAERAALDDLKAKTEGLIQRLDEVKAAMEDEVVTGTDGITKDNVKIADKKALEDAKAAIEKLLEDYSGNLAAAEKQQLNDKLERIGDALDEIARLEKAAENDAADEIARTGDAAHAAPWLALLFAAGGVMAAAAARVGRSARTR